MSQHSNPSQPRHALSGLSWCPEQLGDPELSPLPTPIMAQIPRGSELLGPKPRSDVPTACCTQVTQPLPSQSLKIRLCQLQKRCHHEQKQWGQLGHRVTSQKDMDSYNVSLIYGMGVGAGLGAAVFSISTPPPTHTHAPLTSPW